MVNWRHKLTAAVTASCVNIVCNRIVKGVLWILGEYCENTSSIIHFVSEVKKSIGELPIVESEMKIAAGDTEDIKVEEGKGEKVMMLNDCFLEICSLWS